MSRLINVFKSLFGGIFAFLGGLLGGKQSQDTSAETAPKVRKSKGYFLELEDAQGVKRPPAEPAAPKAAPAASVPAPAAPAPAPVATTNGSAPKAEPVKVAEPAATAKALNLPQPTVTNFATDYLITTSNNGRRRPGANMSSFLDMARQVKTPG